MRWMLCALAIAACDQTIVIPHDAGVERIDAFVAMPDAGMPCASPLRVCGEACVDVSVDPAHCGACDVDCDAMPNVRGPASCAAGQCIPHTCEPGWGICAPRSFECTTPISTPERCGACDHTCPPEVPLCERVEEDGMVSFRCARACAIGELCDGACVDTMSSPFHCGGCGLICPSPQDAVATCALGVCGLECNEGFHLCGGDRCVTGDDVATCGTRCAPCPTRPHMRATCDGTECGLECEPGWADCDDDTSDGCETDLSSEFHCGDCTTRCESPLACGDDGGTFRCFDTCAPMGLVNCGSWCADLSNDISNCGMCRRVCPHPVDSSRVCRDGVCDFVCDPGFVRCGPRCIAEGSPCGA